MSKVIATPLSHPDEEVYYKPSGKAWVPVDPVEVGIGRHAGIRGLERRPELDKKEFAVGEVFVTPKGKRIEVVARAVDTCGRCYRFEKDCYNIRCTYAERFDGRAIQFVRIEE